MRKVIFTLAILLVITISAIWFFLKQEASGPEETVKTEKNVESIEKMGEKKSADSFKHPPAQKKEMAAEKSAKAEYRPFTVKALAGGKVKIALNTPNFEKIKKVDGFAIDIPEKAGPLPEGAPNLPTMVKVISGRDGYKALGDILDAEYVEYHDIDIAPRETRRSILDHKTNKRSVVYELVENNEIYNSDEFWPPKLLNIQEAYKGTQKMTRVEYHPFQYNPATKTLRHYPEIISEISFSALSEPSALAEETNLTLADVDPLFQGISSGRSPSPDFECECSDRVLRAEDLLPIMDGRASDFALRRSGAEADACIKIAVQKTGMHKLYRSTLVNAGVSSSQLVGKQISLFNQGKQVKIYTSTDGLFGSSDYIVFYGVKFQGYHDNKNYYWLGFSGGNTEMETQSVAPLNGYPLVNAACKQQTLSDKVRGPSLSFSGSSTDPYFDGWFLTYTILTTSAKSVTFNGFNYLKTGSSATLSFRLKAMTGNSHQVRVSRGGYTVYTTPTFYDNIFKTFSTAFNVNLLNQSSNGSQVFDFLSRASSLDMNRLDEARLSLDRYLYASGNSLAFGGISGNARYQIRNFTSTPWVFDVTDAANPIRLTNAGYSSGVLTFEDNATSQRCYQLTAFNNMTTIGSSSLSLVNFRNLGDASREAEYIIILGDNTSFDAPAKKLLKHRANQGLTVLATRTDDIFNEFSYGVRDVRGIKQFIGYAFHHWASKPKYILLAGDATADPFNKSLPANYKDYMMTPFQWSREPELYPQDQWYAMVNGPSSDMKQPETVPDVALGRIPVNNASEFTYVVNKIISYENSIVTSPNWSRKAHFVADGKDSGGDFRSDIEKLKTQKFNTFPSSYLTTGYLDYSSDFSINLGIKNKFSSGMYAIVYYGHGNTSAWAESNEVVFGNQDILNLSNGVWPIVGVFSCNNALFTNPTGNDCMAENFIRKNNSGAIAVIASTSECINLVSSFLSLGFYDSLIKNSATKRIGDAFVDGAFELWAKSGGGMPESKTYSVWGDPALLIKK